MGLVPPVSCRHRKTASTESTKTTAAAPIPGARVLRQVAANSLNVLVNTVASPARSHLSIDLPAATAAPSAGQFKQAFDQAFDDGADGVVCVCLSETLSATVQSARMARDMLPGRQIEVVDSRSASMAIGALALRGATMAAQGATATSIAEALTRLRNRTHFYVALETLEYLRRGGRISSTKAGKPTVI